MKFVDVEVEVFVTFRVEVESVSDADIATNAKAAVAKHVARRLEAPAVLADLFQGRYGIQRHPDRGIAVGTKLLGLTAPTVALCYNGHMTTTPVPDHVEVALDTNKLATLLFKAAAKKVDEAAKANGYPVPAETFAAYELASSDLHKSTVNAALVAPVGTVIETVDGPLIVAYRYDVGVDGSAQMADLTADGQPALGSWHEGPVADADGHCPECGPGAGCYEAVQYERYAPEGRVGHGFVDPISRKIVQTG